MLLVHILQDIVHYFQKYSSSTVISCISGIPTNSKQKLYLRNSLKTFFQRRLKLFTSPLRYLGTVGTLRVSLGTTWQSAAYSPSAVGLRLLRFRVIENYEREQRKTCRYHESTFTQSDNSEKHGPKVILVS